MYLPLDLCTHSPFHFPLVSLLQHHEQVVSVLQLWLPAPPPRPAPCPAPRPAPRPGPRVWVRHELPVEAAEARDDGQDHAGQ